MKAILAAAALLIASPTYAKGVFLVRDVMSESGVATGATQHAARTYRHYHRRDRRHRRIVVARHSPREIRHSNRGDALVVGGRPSGCPRQYCGCEAARYLGIHDPRGTLNLAWNWALKFRRTYAHVGAAAVRPHHVLVIIGGGPGRWLVHDGNSGRGLTREHYTALNGYVFVEPSYHIARQ